MTDGMVQSVRPWFVVLIYLFGTLSGAEGRHTFASRGAPRTLLMCAAACLAGAYTRPPSSST